MSTAKRKTDCVCPACGAMHSANAAFCWLCHGPAENKAAMEEIARRPYRIELRSPYQFGLSTTMLIFLLSAVLLGVYSMHPGLGLALTVVAMPALARTCSLSIRRAREGTPMSDMTKVGVFGSSFFVVIGAAALLVVAAAVAFFLVCLAVLSTVT